MTGTVKWFDDQKGYGFIAPDPEGSDVDGKPPKDVFVHHSGINAPGHRTLVDGQAVTFELEDTPKGPAAVNVRSVP